MPADDEPRLVDCVGDVSINLIVMILIVFGGLGFIVHSDLLRWIVSRRHSRMGVSRVIFPELDIARREAQIILNPALTDYIALPEGYSMVEIAAPPEFVGKTLVALHVRVRHGVNVVAVRDQTQPVARLFFPKPDYEFTGNDRLLLIGPHEKIQELTKQIA